MVRVLRRLFGVLFTLGAVVAAIVGAVLTAERLDHRPRTDDAFLDADVVHMAPDVSGRVVAISVRNNQVVHTGDVLFTIDPEPFQLQVEQARAQLAGLQAQLNVTTDQVASQTSKADAANTGIGSAQAQLALASATLARMEPLLPRGYVTAEQVDQARTSQRTAQISLQQARQQAQEARQGVSSTRPAEQQILASKASLALAERNLRLTETRSPCTGVVTGLQTAVGEYGAAGRPPVHHHRYRAMVRGREFPRDGPGRTAARPACHRVRDEQAWTGRGGCGGQSRRRRVAGRGGKLRRSPPRSAQPELGADRAALPGSHPPVLATFEPHAAWRLGRDRDRPMSVTLRLARAQPASGWLEALWDELRPRPGRLADTIRLVVLVMLTVAVGETFRMPEIAVSAYVVLFVSRGERSSTVMTASIAGVAVVLAAFATVVLFMASLSEPAVRVPLIAAMTFAALFLSRISPLGPAAFAAGFIMAYGLTAGDAVLGVALQSSGVSDTTGPAIPQLLFLPPEEALLHFVLWLAPVVALPVTLVVVANLLTGRRPVQLLRNDLADRLAACAAFCAGEPGAARTLAAAARQGTADLAKLHHAAGMAANPPDYASLIDETAQLALALLAWPLATLAEDDPPAGLRPCAAGLRMAERMLRSDGQGAIDVGLPEAGRPAAQPLAAEINRACAAISDALRRPASPSPAALHAASRLIAWDAVRNPETARFALKVTLAVMLSYMAESLLDWPDIHTCVVTCFFVSLGTIGESVHKAALRVTGALIGGALGIASILVLMPAMTDLGDLLLSLGAVTLLAGWIACGSERISYAGWQIGLAYYLTMLQGYGPTLDMQTARDRVIGVVLGNLIVLVVFTTVWPVGVGKAARRQVALAITQMAVLMRLGPEAQPGTAPSRRSVRAGFAAASNSARGLLANTDHGLATVWHAGASRAIDRAAVADLETIMLVVCVVSDLRGHPDGGSEAEPALSAAHAYCAHLAAWFDRCAAWVRDGADDGSLETDIPNPPKSEDCGGPAQAAWFDVLDREIRGIVARILHRTDGRG